MKTPSNGSVSLDLPSPSEYEIEAFDNLEVKIGGRKAVFSSLAEVSELITPQHKELAALLADPQNDRLKLATICKRAGISLRSFIAIYRDANVARAQIEAITNVARSLPLVAADVMRRAQTHDVVCETCHGHKTIPVLIDSEVQDKPCGTCRGIGMIRQEPSEKIQQMALELGGLKSRDGVGRPGIQTNVAVQVTQGDQKEGPSRMHLPTTTDQGFRTATDRLLYPSRTGEEEEPIDAEVTEVEES